MHMPNVFWGRSVCHDIKDSLVTMGCVVMLFISPAAVHAAESGKKAEVHLTGIRVTAEPHDGDAQLRPFGYEPGSALALTVVYPDGGLVGVDRDNSTMDRLVDDTGHSLAAAKDYDDGYRNVQIGKEAGAVVVTYRTTGRPTTGATTIQAQGSLRLYTASGTAQATSAPITFEKGRQFTVGPVTYVIDKVTPSNLSTKRVRVKIHTVDDVRAMKEITFLDGQGSKASARFFNKGRDTVDGGTVSRYLLVVADKPEELTAHGTYYQDLEHIDVPFELEGGLGLMKRM